MDNNCPISAKFNHALRKAGLCAEDNAKDTLLQYCTISVPKHRPSCPKPVLIHANYDELNSCAQKGITCRVLRRGVLLRAKCQLRGEAQA